jgi:hypothetical protein
MLQRAPAQIPASGVFAPGFHLGCLMAKAGVRPEMLDARSVEKLVVANALMLHDRTWTAGPSESLPSTKEIGLMLLVSGCRGQRSNVSPVADVTARPLHQDGCARS